MSKFRSLIPSEQFPAEKDRYVLYVNHTCPWCHRAILIHALKGLAEIIQVVEVDARDSTHGWFFGGSRGPSQDPVHGFKLLKEFYLLADPQYNGRINIPMLWDKKTQTVVNNESSEIARILVDGFDELLPAERREANKGASALLPSNLRNEIDQLNSWVYDNINNGVYKVGFATTQAAYNEHVLRLFHALDRLEQHLTQSNHQPFLFGNHITEADVRLYTTLIRFDVVYYTMFRCNLKMIRTDYPRLHEWLRTLYWSECPETGGGMFKRTTLFDVIKRGYSSIMVSNGIVPIGPMPNIMPL
ncbi:glutathione S-transferase [Karstenula rhodostoma CBS 690.94]|uniref:Glutathione S-transferase n=1 Tax=Karstenula rhodostoma CBS 690.94 TaxID=1392251 RepID=A0A9P4PK29_9PLEO|nr:glutathione S-transferase [Karstenula rhodostoma CBS 690.94]